MRSLTTIVYILAIFLVNSGIAFANSIDCSSESNHKIKLEKENLSVLCRWYNDDNALNYLVERKLDKKARTLTLRIFKEDQTYSEKPIEMNTRVHKEERDGTHYLVKFDIHDGRKMVTKITPDRDWGTKLRWEVDPKLVTDPERKLLKLKGHDGISYYSFFYLPSDFDKNRKQKVVVLLQGGTGAYLHEPDRGEFLDIQTVTFLREAGYLPLLANFRGKARLSNQFRLTGTRQMHNHGIRDIVTALDALSKKVSIDKNDIRVIGHSRGGHMAMLLATRLSEITKEYKIAKTVVSSGVFNTIDGYYSFYKDLEEIINPEKNLDFVDDDWTDGALTFRPAGKFSKDQWEQIQKYEKEHFDNFFKDNYDRPMRFSQTKAYFDQSPYHHADGLQGTILALSGNAETNGNCSFHGPYQFQERVGNERITVKLHEWGHGFPNETFVEDAYNESIRRGVNFWKEEVLNYLRD